MGLALAPTMPSLPTVSNRRVCGIALLAALLGCPGCSVGSLRAGEPPGAPAGVRQMAAPGSTAGPVLYVGGRKLSMYALGSATPLHSTKTPYVARAALALDSHGNLCEATGDVSALAIYAFNARTLQLEGARDGQGVGALVADRSGFLYGTNGIDIFVYAPGCTRNVYTIRNCGCWPLVFDRSGNLYGGAGREVRIYAPTQKPGHMKFVRAIHDGINGTGALAIRPSGELFVANDGNSSVSVFKPGGTTPARRITKGIDAPYALAVDSKGRLYVSNVPGSPPSANGWVSVYAPRGTRPIRTLSYGKAGAPGALAVDSSDNVYVAVDNSVRIYSPGGAKLLRRITKDVDGPTGLLIGSP
jgi:hypothetical protein